MRCTNDIKARIKNEVKPIVEEIINKYKKAIDSEKDKIYLWKKNKLNSLKDQIAPLVNTWAKDLKKNSSSYTWEGCPSSMELAEKILHKMFSEGYYRDSFPDVSTKKLKELQAQKDLFRRRTIGNDPSDGLSLPNWQQVAQTFGLAYCKIEEKQNLSQQIKEVMSQDGAVLCEVCCTSTQAFLHNSYTRDSKGRFVRRSLEDQSPFLEEQVLRDHMLIPVIDR